MVQENWSARHITDSAQRILKQIPSRASDRGLHVVDSSSIVMLALWSLLLWERKVGRVALERVGVDPFELARSLDKLLTEKAREHTVVYDEQQGILVLAKTGEPYRHWDFQALLEPLLQQAEHEALDLGHNYVGSEHLVLAIMRDTNPSMSALLQQHGLSHERVKEAVRALLQG
ncbi:MAG TPA: Clp protease N-terminal domain-containing protein [Gemmata sp.]|jgi:ATP-dependent Clp protease ATP-binding subunit ClpA|nr:Clp protease N-terminal domain-containing protein [Gemmata sp.]